MVSPSRQRSRSCGPGAGVPRRAVPRRADRRAGRFGAGLGLRRGRSSPGSAGRACRSPRKRAARVSASSRRRFCSRSSAGRCTPVPFSGRSRSRCRAPLRSFGLEVAAGGATLDGRAARQAGLVPDLGVVDRVAVVDEDGIWAVEGGRARCWRRWTRRAGSATARRRAADAPRRGRRRCRASRRDPAARARRARARGGWDRATSARALHRAREDARAVRGARSASTRRSRMRWPTRTAESSWRSLAYWAAWCVAEQDEAGAARCAPRPRRLPRGCGRRGLRAGDPGARRRRLHVGARPPPLLQARAVDRRIRRLRARAASGGRAELLDVRAPAAVA